MDRQRKDSTSVCIGFHNILEVVVSTDLIRIVKDFTQP